MLKNDVKTKLEISESLPTLPAVAVQLLNLVGQPGVSVSQLAKIIKQDPALSAKVLRVVNSPLYSLRRRVMNLNHAISLLGLHAVETIALSFTLAETIRNSKTKGFDRDLFWKRSVLSAVAAQELGGHFRIPGSESLFIGALLQDIGMLALSEVFPDAYSRLAGDAGDNHERLISLEVQVFGGDHAEVGDWLVETWNFPVLLREMIKCSHTITKPPTPTEESMITGCVALSGWIAEVWVGRESESAGKKAGILAARLLGLEDAEFAGILDRIAEIVPEVSGLFEVEVQSEQEIARLVARAKEALFLIGLRSAAQIQQAISQVDELRLEVNELKARSQRDPLTGLYNRVILQSVLESEITRAKDLKTPLTLVVCDIDHFKQFNDTYGHAAGDLALQSVAHVLSFELRTSDQAFRYGGEEFVLLLRDTQTKGAFQACERLRRCVERNQVTLEDGQHVAVTASFGFATLSDVNKLDKPSALFRCADQALYAAKEAGRNCTINFHEL
jgi:diguanylate cyclase (GGDEF)-like protein